MKRSFLFGLVFIAYFGPAVRAEPEGQGDRAVAVRALFRKHCAGCHGAELARPSGRFGYVLDLKRLAANPEMVVPGKPNESELYNLIRTDQMPPRNALNGEQKETVRAWILAGAPPLPPDADDSAGTTAGAPFSDDVRRVLADAGRFHLMVLHFPIAFLVAAAFVDVWASGRKQTVPSPTVRFCLSAGAVTAVVAAALGWCYAAVGHGAALPYTLFWHRWLGTGVAVWSVLAALLMERDVRRGKRESLGQLTVILGAVLVGATAYFGGELIHGDLFTSW
jgi:mono/diheme cytochrome c family protein/uncharacterized membrane protein